MKCCLTPKSELFMTKVESKPSKKEGREGVEEADFIPLWTSLTCFLGAEEVEEEEARGAQPSPNPLFIRWASPWKSFSKDERGNWPSTGRFVAFIARAKEEVKFSPAASVKAAG